MRRFAATALTACAATSAFAQELPDGVGVETPSGSVFSSEISYRGDTDDYVFQGFSGMSVTVTVKLARGSTLMPLVELIRPGGTLVEDEDLFVIASSAKSASVAGTLDATGLWKVRVLVAAAAPEASASALRILRNESPGQTKGLFGRAFDSLVNPLVTASDHLEGDALSIGDVTGDGLPEIVISRDVPVSSGSQTRILASDK